MDEPAGPCSVCDRRRRPTVMMQCMGCGHALWVCDLEDCGAAALTLFRMHRTVQFQGRCPGFPIKEDPDPMPSKIVKRGTW